MKNKYPGLCHNCGTQVQAGAGHYVNGRARYGHNRARKAFGAVWCSQCFDRADNSSVEDRCCGNTAYEDACAAACGC